MIRPACFNSSVWTQLLSVTGLIVCVASLVNPLSATDPCGMVPPVYTGKASPITRIGLQKTYVFYRDGVESFVIRPGFSGSVDQFGMLIPFPTVPAIRKVPDNIFEQVANAIDPPEVLVDLRPMRGGGFFGGGGFGGGAGGGGRGLMLLAEKKKVVVVKEEAVGMYEVAVLEAGSAEALKRWMDEHGYRFPDGMEKVTEEYIDSGWCFVAVKTRVGIKSAADPKPGQRKIDNKLKPGSTFDGHVQGMGFRFRTDELVVPMRLSAFNGGDLRNVVYLLTDGPKRIRAIPEEFVRRQLTGARLYGNLTEPLPMRIVGGGIKDISRTRRRQLITERDARQFMASAEQLFTSDLFAADTGELSLGHEETEKQLLQVGERFGLRGPEMDSLISDRLQDERRAQLGKTLRKIGGMTMTVVDGDFPRDILARDNLRFDSFQIAARKNRPRLYDAKHFDPRPETLAVVQQDP